MTQGQHPTYLFPLRARGALGAGKATVTLFALFARGSNEPDQAWMALWEEERASAVAATPVQPPGPGPSHGLQSHLSGRHPKHGTNAGDAPHLAEFQALYSKGCASHQRGPWRGVPTAHLFPFGSRISFEAGEPWGTLRGRRQRDQRSHPQTRPPPPPLPGGLGASVTHHGAGGTIRAGSSWETLLALKHSDPPREPRPGCPHPQSHPRPASPPRPPASLDHSPRGRGSLEGHQDQASPGPPGGQWGQSSQEGLPSRLLPAGRQGGQGGTPMLEGPVTPAEDCCSGTPRSLGQNPGAPRIFRGCPRVSTFPTAAKPPSCYGPRSSGLPTNTAAVS